MTWKYMMQQLLNQDTFYLHDAKIYGELYIWNLEFNGRQITQLFTARLHNDKVRWKNKKKKQIEINCCNFLQKKEAAFLHSRKSTGIL